MSNEKETFDLDRGTFVVAVRDLDPNGADVKIGDVGVVFERADAHRDGFGPMVGWVKKDGRFGRCNVYAQDVRIRLR